MSRNFESTWNEFNAVADFTKDNPKLHQMVKDLQSKSERNRSMGAAAQSDLEALLKLRENEAYLQKEIVRIERDRRKGRGFIIMGLVILNAIEFIVLIYLILNFVVEVRT